jgi:hypothetical protein
MDPRAATVFTENVSRGGAIDVVITCISGNEFFAEFQL